MLSLFLKYAPVSVKARIEQRPNVQLALGNAAWLFGDRIARMGVGLFVSVWVARYLGPEQFGLLHFGLAIVALLSSLAMLGLNGVVVRDLVEKPEAANLTLGTTFMLLTMGGVLAYFLAIIVVSFARPNDDLARLMVIVLGFTMVFKSADVVRFWFESQVKSKYVVWVDNAVFAASVVVRIGLVLAKAPLIAFAVALLIDVALTAAGLFLAYRKKVGKVIHWNASFSRAKSLLSESWPLVVASAASMINTRIGQVLLGATANDSLVGNYSAAVSLSEIWLVIPVILGASIFPALISAKQRGESIYRSRIIRTSYYMAMVFLPIAFGISIWAHEIVHVLYGSRYDTAGDYLSILIWSGVPYLIFFAFNQMIYIERLLTMSLYVSVIAIISNVMLNLLLLPRYGATGAAIATLVTSLGSTSLSLIIINARTKIFWGAADGTR